MALSPLNRRRWRNFKANRRAFWSLWVFLVLFALSLAAELIANDRPILVSYRGDLYAPVFRFYPDGTSTGGEVEIRAASERRVIAVNWLTGNARTVLQP